jgi:4-amino-4-deoxy-L-arabinose transferase-like glycosyltransferase
MQTYKDLNLQKIIKKSPKSIWVFSLIWLLILSWIAFVNNLGDIGLLDKTEPMFVEAARQMVVTGDWITPYWNGETRFDKPPLSYWLMAIAFKIFGINEWAARIPSALMAIAMTGLGFWTLHKVGFASPSMQNKPDSQRHLWTSAWIGTGIITLNFPIIAWARTGVSDMFLAASMSIALCSFFLGYAEVENENEETKQGFLTIPNRWYLIFYIFTALAVLAKGPVAIVLEMAIIVSFSLYLGNFRQLLSEIKFLPGSLLFTAIALPWFVLVTLANGSEYINVFFGRHNVERFTTVVSSHPGPIYYYVLVILLGFLPWSVYLPIAIARLRFWKRDYWRSVPRSTHLGIFCLFWFVVIFVFFSISVTKLPSYVLPLMPAAAILVTLLWSGRMGTLSIGTSFERKEKPSKISRGFLVSAIVNIVILLILAIASYLSPQLIGKDSAVPYMKEALQVSGLPVQSALVWGMGAIACLVLLAKKYHRWLWSANLATFLAFMIFVAPPAAALMDAQRQLPIRQLSALITKVDRPNEDILVVGFIRPSVVFYTQRNVRFLSDIKKALAHLKATANNKPDTVLILSLPKYPFRMHLTPQDYQLLGKEGAYQLIRVQKEKVLRLN